MQSFRNVDVWHKAHALTLSVFRATEQFPKSETFGLSVQLRRYAMSVPLRIAEGCGKATDAEFRHCLQQAFANAVELEYLLLLAHDLRYMEVTGHELLQEQLVQVRKMLSGLMRTLSTRPV